MKRIKTAFVFSLKTLPRAVIVASEIAMVLFVIMALAITVFLGKLAHAPMDLSFVKEMVIDSLSPNGRDFNLDFDRAILSWPELSGPFHLRLSGIHLEESGKDVAVIRDVELLIARSPLLWGRIRPVRLIIDAPEVGITRDKDHRLRLSLADDQSETAKNFREQNAVSAATNQNLMNLFSQRLFDQSNKDIGILSRIEEVEIRNARLHITDHLLDMEWNVPRANVLFQQVDIGIMGTASVEMVDGQQLSIQMTYQRERDRFLIKSEVKDFPLFNLAGRVAGIDQLRHQDVPLTGTLTAGGKLNPFQVDLFRVEAKSKRGSVDIGNAEMPVLVPVADLNLDLSYDRSKAGWNISTFGFNVDDVPVQVGAVISQDQSGAYQGAVQFKIPKINQDKMTHYWPHSFRDEGVGKWMTQKLSGASFTDVRVDVPIWAGRRNDQFSVAVIPPRAEWRFENLRANYHEPLMPITNGAGSGVFENDTITINVTSGDVQNLKIQKGTVKLTDVTKAGAGDAHIDITLAGPVRTILEYIKDEPIALGNKIPIAIDKVDGTGTYHAVVSFPTLKDLPKDQVKADVDAVIDHIILPKIVKGQTLSGGPFMLTGKDGMLTFSGKGKISDRDISLNWKEPIAHQPKGPCAVGTIDVDTDENLRQAIGMGVSFLDGSMPVHIDYKDCFSGVQTANVKADVTPTRVSIPLMGYEKPLGKLGQIALDVIVRDKGPVSIKNANVKMPDISVKKTTIDIAVLPDGTMGVTKAIVPDYIFKNSSGAIIYNRYKNRIAVDIAGPAFDLGPFLTGASDNTSSPPMNVKMNVDRLGFGGVSVLEGAALNIDIDQNSDLDRMDITGRAGTGNVLIKYLPDGAGRMTLNVNAEDAGAFLRVLNVYDNIKGGTLVLNAVPIGDNNRDVKGMLVMRDFSVVKAPILAQLLGAMSVKGLGDQLTNQGIGFDRLESGFAFVRRTGKDLMSFREGRTSGSSLGMTFDGLYDRRNGTIDVSGTIIPVSGVNKMASKIPLLGRLIAGGDDSALFAVTYGVKGPVDNPTTSINPLAVLTPGILRRLFFEDRPDDPLATPKGRLNE